MPAVWANLTGDFHAMNLANWQFAEYEDNTQLRIIEFNGAVCVSDCIGLTSGEGQFDYIAINPSYIGTIVFGGPVTAYWMWQAGGTIDQPNPTSVGITSTDLTITQWWQWEDGTLNSTGYAASVFVVGAVAHIGKSEWGVGDGIIELGSNLVFEEEAEADIRNRVNFFLGTGIDVLGGSGVTFAADTALTSALAVLDERQTIRVAGQHSRILTQGALTADLGLWVNGGTAELRGAATGEAVVRFQGPVLRANGTNPLPPFPSSGVSVYMTSGNLIIGEGAKLDVGDHKILVNGGRLATRATAGHPTHEAGIVAHTLVVDQPPGATTEVIICDPTLNPPGMTDHVYGTLNVSGLVRWFGGAYRPIIGPPDTASASFWTASNGFWIGSDATPPPSTPVLSPILPAQPPPVDSRYLIISASNGSVTRYQTPTFAPTSTGWVVQPSVDPHRSLVIKRAV